MTTLTETLKTVDLFNKNCQLLFSDIIDCIGNKVIPLNGFSVLVNDARINLSARESQNCRDYMFQIEIEKAKIKMNRICFVLMLVKMRDALFNDIYKSICRHLEVDFEFPLLLVTGIIEPSNLDEFNTSRKNTMYRLWMYHTLQVSHGIWRNNFSSYSDSPFNLASDDYKFEELLNLRIKPGITDRNLCENATFKIRRLTDITDSNKILDIVDELLSM